MILWFADAIKIIHNLRTIRAVFSCNRERSVLKYNAVYSIGLTAYLGDENSYSHAAAEKLTGGELKGYCTFSDVIAAVTAGECRYAVLPLENNVEGAVNEVYDRLCGSGLYVLRQGILPVRHSLIAAEGAELNKIVKVVSHPQAIAQCRKYLSSLGVPLVSVSSTSAALEEASTTVAAVAQKPKAGQTVLASGIQDSDRNATRFGLLGKTEERERGGSVSIAFDLKNTPGALLSTLTAVAERGVNMTRILSRPHRDGDGKYRFFVDFDFSGTGAELNELFGALKRECENFTFLGRYDVERL